MPGREQAGGERAPERAFDAVVFDLLTALLDSWLLWNRVAGSAERSGGRYAAIATAESVGYYKPRPEPYRAVLAKLGTDPARTLFVAGSAADVPGAKRVGMPVYWHNRMGLDPLDECRPDFTATSLRPLLDLV